MADNEKVKGIEVGPPLFIESLLNPKEFRENAQRHPNTHSLKEVRPLSKFEEGQFKCRYRMGESPTKEERDNANANLDYLLSKVNENGKDKA